MASTLRTILEENESNPSVRGFIEAAQSSVIAKDKTHEYYEGIIDGLGIAFGMPKDIIENSEMFTASMGALLAVSCDRYLKMG